MKTIDESELENFRMVARKDKPGTVIHEGMVKDWVGIGWVTVRKATAADKKKFPVAVRGK